MRYLQTLVTNKFLIRRSVVDLVGDIFFRNHVLFIIQLIETKEFKLKFNKFFGDSSVLRALTF